MPERVTTVLISSEPHAFTNTSKYTAYFDILFTPPEPVSGKCCYFQVKQCALREIDAVDDAETSEPRTWLISLDWRQPNSFCCIYDEDPYLGTHSGVRDTQGKVPSGMYNNVVAVVHKSAPYSVYHTESPRCLVDIPQGPHKLRVSATLLKADDGVTTNSESYPWNITLFGELIPIETMN